MAVTCVAFLWCLWEPVQAALLTCLGTAVGDCLTCLQGRAVALFRNIISSWGNAQVGIINTPTAHLVGLEEINGYLETIVGYLKDDTVGIIGIYGMGKVGKTTLLKKLHNDFHKIGAPGSYVLIWVTVTREDARILRIQKEIGDELGLSLSADTKGSSSLAEEQAKEQEQAKAIFKAFCDSEERFLLLLDDVWDELDLVKVGIPCPTEQNNKCIIILTTRSKRVCNNMGAKKHLVKVNKLNDVESWKLFKKSLGTEIDLDDSRISELAKAVADKCDGLPLALITVGKAKAAATSAGVWEEALEQLRATPHKLSGMEDKVLSPLKYSFDRLGDENTQQCLLYCCLFPEDHEIPVEEVIEYWVGEGFLEDPQSESIIRARNRGLDVIDTLQYDCLLESERVNISRLKMHDVFRQMCLWLTGGEFDKSNTFLAYAGLNRVPRSDSWGDAKRISLMYNTSQKSQALLRKTPSCPNLRTLLCNRFSLCSIPPGFFKSMPALCVLNLSGSGLASLPEEISCLVELRYLNLQSTFIESLPTGLSRLTKLSQLDLDYTTGLSLIPQEVIPTLTSLQVLGMYRSCYNFNLPNESPDTSDDKMREDTSSYWDRLEELRLTVRTLSCLEMLFKFDWLCLCITRLDIYFGGDTGITAARASDLLGKLGKVLRSLDVIGDGQESEVQFNSRNRFGSTIEELVLSDVPKITVVVSSPSFFDRLRLLRISGCHGIRDLMWIRQLPRLEEIDIVDCVGVEELLPEVNGGGLEQRGVGDGAVDCDRASLLALRSISLRELPELKSISGRPLLLPFVEHLNVIRCTQLKKLPLGPDSAQKIIRIRGEREWWERLEWHQDADGRSVSSRLLPRFVPLA